LIHQGLEAFLDLGFYPPLRDSVIKAVLDAYEKRVAPSKRVP
jgi:hypothetical protein